MYMPIFLKCPIFSDTHPFWKNNPLSTVNYIKQNKNKKQKRPPDISYFASKKVGDGNITCPFNNIKSFIILFRSLRHNRKSSWCMGVRFYRPYEWNGYDARDIEGLRETQERRWEREDVRSKYYYTDYKVYWRLFRVTDIYFSQLLYAIQA